MLVSNHENENDHSHPDKNHASRNNDQSYEKKDINHANIDELKELDLQYNPHLKNRCCPDAIEFAESEFCTEVPENKVIALNALTCLKEKDQTVISKEYSKNIIDFSFLKMRKEEDYYNYFSEQTLLPPEMKCYSEANFSQGTTVQNYCIEVTTQELVRIPDPEFDSAISIQRNAQNNANIWLNTLNRQVIGINTNARNFCDLIITYEDDIDFLVDSVVQNKPSAIDNFLDEMGLLRDEAYRRSRQIDDVTTGLNGFRELIAADGVAFRGIKRKANEKYNADTGEIAELERTVERLKAQIKIYNATIAGGSVGFAFGALLIVLGVVSLIFSGGISSFPVIGAGITIAGSGGGAVAQAIIGRNTARNEYKNAMFRISNLQETIALLQAINDQLSSLINSNLHSVYATQAMSTGFGILGNNINGIMENIDLVVGNISSGAALRRMLRVLINSAKDLRALYSDAERQGILPVDPSTRVWNTLFPYRKTVPSKPRHPISMDEYAILLQKKVVWNNSLRYRCY